MSETQPADSNTPVTEEQIIKVLRGVYDPEIPVSIYDLGLIYDIRIDDDVVHVRMTLTTPACPVAGILPGQVETRVKAIEGVSDATVELVWDPPWTPDKMSEAAKLQLNMDMAPSPREKQSFVGVRMPPRRSGGSA